MRLKSLTRLVIQLRQIIPRDLIGQIDTIPVMLCQSKLQPTSYGLDFQRLRPRESQLGGPSRSTSIDGKPYRSDGAGIAGSIPLAGSTQGGLTHGYGGPERGRPDRHGATLLNRAAFPATDVQNLHLALWVVVFG